MYLHQATSQEQPDMCREHVTNVHDSWVIYSQEEGFPHILETLDKLIRLFSDLWTKLCEKFTNILFAYQHCRHATLLSAID